MNKEHDVEKLKSDLEHLVTDCKKIFGSFKDTLKEEVAHTRGEFEDHIHKIKNKIAEESSSSWLQYVGIAFVVGVVVGAAINKKKI